MEKIGIYCRVSSKSQEDDGTSIDYQLKKGNEISKKLGMNPIIYNEGGKSSWDSNINTRIELVRLLNNVESKKIKSVWVWNMDRMGRNSQSWYSILKILVGYRVNLYVGDSLKPYNFSNPTDRLVTNILSLITTYDNELRRIRMIFGKMETLKRGRTFIGGTIPFGYDVDESKNLIPNSESRMIGKMFQMYEDGKSTTDIQVMLNQSNHFPRRSKKGWNLGTIQFILKNTIYVGEQIWNWKEQEMDGSTTIVETIKIKTPKLIDKRLFDKVQRRFSGYLTHNQYDTELLSLLKGLLKCNHCGLPMNHRYKRRNYYYCVYTERTWKDTDRSKLPKFTYGVNTCSMKKSLVIQQTDEIVWDEFLKVFSNSKWIKEQFKVEGLEPKNKLKKEVTSSIKKKRNEVVKLKKYLDSMNDSLIEIELKNMNKGYSNKKIYEGLLKKVDSEIESVTKQIDDVNKEILQLKGRDKWIDWVQQMNKEIEEMKDWSLEDKKVKLNQFINTIYVNYDEKEDEHNLMVDFSLPILGDNIVYIDNKDKSKGYNYEEGVHQLVINHKNRKTQPTKNKLDLLKMITQMRTDGKTFMEISIYLNLNKIPTIRGKKWSKDSVSRFYNYSNQNEVVYGVQNGDTFEGDDTKKK